MSIPGVVTSDTALQKQAVQLLATSRAILENQLTKDPAKEPVEVTATSPTISGGEPPKPASNSEDQDKVRSSGGSKKNKSGPRTSELKEFHVSNWLVCLVIRTYDIMHHRQALVRQVFRALCSGQISPPPRVDSEAASQFDQDAHIGPTCEDFCLELSKSMTSKWNVKAVDVAAAEFMRIHPHYADQEAQVRAAFAQHAYYLHSRHTKAISDPSGVIATNIKQRREARRKGVRSVP